MLETNVSRAQVKDLLDQWTSLKDLEEKANKNSPRNVMPTDITSENDLGDSSAAFSGLPLRFNENDGRTMIANESTDDGQHLNGRHIGFDAHYPMPGGNSGGDTHIFFGASSSLVLATEVLFHTRHDPSLVGRDFSVAEASSERSLPREILPHDSVLVQKFCPSPELTRYLIDNYINTVHVLYPLTKTSSISSDLLKFCDLFGSRTSSSTTSTHTTSSAGTPATPSLLPSTEIPIRETHAIFRIAIMCAISVSHLSRNAYSDNLHEREFYDLALSLLEPVTAELSANSLHTIILLILYYLSRPQRGDIWMMLDSATRLVVQLGYHTAPLRGTSQNEEVWDEEEDAEREVSEWKRNMFWCLFSLERTVSQCFGRPSDMLQAVLTVQHPPLSMDQSQNTAAFLHRLASLRSEIFNDVYLSAEMSCLSPEWYSNHYTQLQKWYQDAAFNHDPNSDAVETGIGQVALRLAYHNTAIFIFQRELLAALQSTYSSFTTNPPIVSSLLSDSYTSACNIIKLYTNILESGKDAELSRYPLTFVAAHEMFAAGFTYLGILILHLRLDRSNTDENLEQHLRPGTIHDVVIECTVLLAWCAGRWEGFDGMVQMFKTASSAVLSMVARY